MDIRGRLDSMVHRGREQWKELGLLNEHVGECLERVRELGQGMTFWLDSDLMTGLMGDELKAREIKDGMTTELRLVYPSE